jgi:hypothetical protein
MIDIPFGNSNLLSFFDKKQWCNELPKIEVAPDVVLLSSWEQDESSLWKIQPLIIELINLGCKYFVCAGKYSEELHDFIDDIVLTLPSCRKQEEVNRIITTWHDTDTNSEVADFFLHSTNVSSGLLIAFIDNKELEDSMLKKAILDLAKEKL